MSPTQPLLSLAVAVNAMLLLVAIDAKLDPATRPKDPEVTSRHRLREFFHPSGRQNTSSGATAIVQVSVTRRNHPADMRSPLDRRNIPAELRSPLEVSTSRKHPDIHSAIVLSSSSRQSLHSVTTESDANPTDRQKFIRLSKATRQDISLEIPKRSSEEDSTFEDVDSVFGKTSSLSGKKKPNRYRRKNRRRKSRRYSSRKLTQLNKEATRRKTKLQGISRFAFQLLSANSDRSKSKGKGHVPTKNEPGKTRKDSAKRRRGRKNKKKNKKIVIAEQVNFPPLKERCKTQPMRQEIRVEGCSPKAVMNNFCYGQCISVYIPEAQGTGRGRPSFVSCGFCRPKDIQHISVQLQCRGRKSWRMRWVRQKVPFVKECRCMDQKVKV